ncbi:hypothetical protein NLM24_04190 [Nocardia zapadnayensis]|uniref:hypothetical protein n=1 Tax=Nocardia rhamnosiphila TaxID=426716 RepID=UPI0022460999|nr:hypothetical protein [Nocardia zapadnayensis]MCX0269919.1 hypothetical protein [Nocardia zapadnayensis]
MIKFLAHLSGTLLVLLVALIQPWAAPAAIGLVVVGWWWRWAAVGAVLLVIGVLALSDTGLVAAAAAGLVATAYLLNIATVTAPRGVVPTTLPSVVGAVLWTAAAGSAALLPIELVWAPVVAPVLVILLSSILTYSITTARRRPPSVSAADTGDQPAARADR